MKIKFTIRKFAIAFSLVSITVSLGQSALAEPTRNPNDGYQSNEQDSTSSTFGNSFSPFDLIHNANFRRSRGMAEFSEDSQTNINSEAEKFKQLQRERLEAQPAEVSPTSPASN